MKPKTFTIDCGPGTQWKIRVLVWPSRAAMRKRRNEIERTCNGCEAFFHDFTSSKQRREANWKERLIGECHFYRGKGLKLENVVHEAAHAAVAYAYMCSLEIYKTRDGEEEFVKSIQHITGGIMWAVKRRKK